MARGPAGMPSRMRRTTVAAGLLAVTTSACTATSTPSVRVGAAAAPTASETGTSVSVVERDRRGDDWRIHPHRHGRIEGFADHVSVGPGQRFTLYVSTTATSYVVRAFRMGWYGGHLGRLVWSSSTLRGVRQPAARVLRPLTTVEAPWRPSAVVDTTDWPAGDYLLRLDASSGAQSYVPLSVRTTSAEGAVVLVSPVTTWQAYNTWGCCDLYQGGDGSYLTRSRAVSFDRPYAQDRGAGEFLTRELPVLAEAERLGLPLDYVTDVDLQTEPGLLTGARAVISMGHDEYWSVQMRDAVTAARDAGTNVAFLGANAVFRRIRFASTALGPDRLEVNYKDAAEDPVSRSRPELTTANWPSAPHAQPESSLTGAMYDCFPAHGAGVVVDPSNWLFAGTGVGRGTRLPRLVGPETDRVQPAYPTPRPLEVLMHSPFWCGKGYRSYADTTYYTTASGAGVFDAGTIDWVCAIDRGCGVSPLTARVVRRVTDTLLAAFAAGPAGRKHPARDNLGALRIDTTPLR